MIDGLITASTDQNKQKFKFPRYQSLKMSLGPLPTSGEMVYNLPWCVQDPMCLKNF